MRRHRYTEAPAPRRRAGGPTGRMIEALERLREDRMRAILDERPEAEEAAFARFCDATAPDWDRLAADLFRRWPMPAGTGPDDLVQEMHAEAWDKLPEWHPGMRSLADYIVWNACAVAKKWMHGQRNSYRRDDKTPGRFPMCASAFELRRRDGTIVEALGDGGPDGDDRLYEGEAPQAAFMEGLELYRRLVAALPGERAALFERVVEMGGDLEAVAERVYREEPRFCLRHRLGSPRDVARLVRETVDEAAAMAAADA